MAFILVGCQNNDDLLVGLWEFDGDSTLAELNQKQNVPKSVLACYTSKSCGYNTRFTYTSTTWSAITDLGYESFSHGPVKYEVLRSTPNSIEIRTKEGDEITTYTATFLDENTYYLNLKHKEFEWKEYLRRRY